MVESCIEDCLLIVSPALNNYTAQIVVPTLAGIGIYFIKSYVTRLLGVKIQHRILLADKRYAYRHFDNLARLGIVSVPYTYVVTGYRLAEIGIKLVLGIIDIPFGLNSLFGSLKLPEALLGGLSVDSHCKIEREHCLRIVAESAHKLASYHFGV